MERNNNPNMSGKIYPKMDREQRAKQFGSFDALRGLREVLMEKEKIRVEKSELSEEYKEEMNRTMMKIEKNMMVEIVYYCKGEYLKMAGMVARFDKDLRTITIVNTKISFDDIYKIKIMD